MTREEAISILEKIRYDYGDYMPTLSNTSFCEAIEALKQPKRVHGRWIPVEWTSYSGNITFHGALCSNCSNRVVSQKNYCPNCGAIMDEGNSHGIEH